MSMRWYDYSTKDHAVKVGAFRGRNWMQSVFIDLENEWIPELVQEASIVAFDASSINSMYEKVFREAFESGAFIEFKKKRESERRIVR